MDVLKINDDDDDDLVVLYLLLAPQCSEFIVKKLQKLFL